MFFVSLLLNQTLSWMRTQSGTTSLRAILYMDEIFGYLPPVANPPSKLPLLTMLKQARAYGLGLVLATQNPVDLDYKALSNIGTWFIGRVQTERDKARLLEGLEGAAAGTGRKFDRRAMEETLAGLGSRIFLMNNVHEDAPVTFETRWAMSYLRGPLTRNQIKTLAQVRPDRTRAPAAKSVAKPLLPPEVKQYFAPIRRRRAADAELMYVPMIGGAVDVHVRDKRMDVEADESLFRLAAIKDGPDPVDWDESQSVEFGIEELEETPEESDAEFMAPPSAASKARKYGTWGKDLTTWVYRTHTVDLLKSPSLKIVSQPGESERDFRIRLQQAGREFRDAELGKLREKYASKEATLQRRLQTARARVEREADQAKQRKIQTAISFGATLLGAFMGRKRLSVSSVSRATSTARSASRILKENEDVGRARESVEAVEAEMARLDAAFHEDTAELMERLDPLTEALEAKTLRPLKRDISVRLLALVWTPHWKSADGKMTAAV